MLQQYNLKEDDFRGELFKSHKKELNGCNDILCLTQPQIIEKIHEDYLIADADIIETNTFNAQCISLKDYGLEGYAYEINYNAAKIACKIAAQYSKDTPRFVAGSVGPTNKHLSLLSDINNPAYRELSFDDFVDAYKQQINGLIDGDVDLILIETVFDTLVAKAALFAAQEVFEEKGKTLPVMLSLTVSAQGGRNLSGQTIEAFLISISHYPVLSVGLNCSFGASLMKPYLEELSEKAPFYISLYPNAGLPNQFGGYDETAREMAEILYEYAQDNLLNIAGGCCGTTPEHIKEIKTLLSNCKPRKIPAIKNTTCLSGLETLMIDENSNFLNIGERTNVSGSKKFARFIREKKYEEALAVAGNQVENGALSIDVNLDDGLIDAKSEIVTFLNYLTSSPEISKVPVMIDSSDWEVIVNGLKCLQGKSIINSISLKDGEDEFINKAKFIKKFGAAVVVMAFDEKGQATTYQRKIEICKRSYALLINKLKFNPADIIFDPNILTIGTGIKEHNNFAVDYINAVKWIKENLHGVKTSGGISNLSFAFRGDDRLRNAMHSVFLYYAIEAGLDMGIVNAGTLPVYDDIDNNLKELITDLIFNKREDATERLYNYAQQYTDNEIIDKTEQNRELIPIAERLTKSIIKGSTDYIEGDIEVALKEYPSALSIIEGPLMQGINTVGELFGDGKMFLPQIMKSARVMKKAVAKLQPTIEKENNPDLSGKNNSKSGKILLATVKGDVHDIGKNIVSVVLACNNFEIIDLGLMVAKERIVDEAIKQNVDIVGLSGLIAPSLEEMVKVAKEMEKNNLKIPLLIGGAATSVAHTAVKIDNVYSGVVVYIPDASKSVSIVNALIKNKNNELFLKKIKEENQKLRIKHINKSTDLISLAEARKNRFVFAPTKAKIVKPLKYVHFQEDIDINLLLPFVNWSYFFYSWDIHGKYPAIFAHPEKGKEAKELHNNALNMLEYISKNKIFKPKAIVKIFETNSDNEDIVVYENGKEKCKLHFLRNQSKNKKINYCLSDFIAPKSSNIKDYIGLFALTIGYEADEFYKLQKAKNNDYSAVIIKILSDRLADAYSEYLHCYIGKNIWGYFKDDNFDSYRGIKPAPGYNTCPDHSEKKTIFDLLEASEYTGIILTENYTMKPTSSICGYYFAHPEAKYFDVGKINDEQLIDYAKRKNVEVQQIKKWLTNF